MTLYYERLKDAIYYICNKASSNPDILDPIKLNKVLWYSDALAYMRTGSSITNERYIRKPRGPVARRNRIAVDALAEEGVMYPGRSTSDQGYWETHFDVVGEREDCEDDEFGLTDDEKEMIDRVYENVVIKHSSMGISDRSHGAIWELADNDEDVPLYTVFAEEIGPVTQKHFDMAMEGLTRCQ